MGYHANNSRIKATGNSIEYVSRLVVLTKLTKNVSHRSPQLLCVELFDYYIVYSTWGVMEMTRLLVGLSVIIK